MLLLLQTSDPAFNFCAFSIKHPSGIARWDISGGEIPLLLVSHCIPVVVVLGKEMSSCPINYKVKNCPVNFCAFSVKHPSGTAGWDISGGEISLLLISHCTPVVHSSAGKKDVQLGGMSFEMLIIRE